MMRPVILQQGAAHCFAAVEKRLGHALAQIDAKALNIIQGLVCSLHCRLIAYRGRKGLVVASTELYRQRNWEDC